MSRQDKATSERNTRTLRELVKRPENKVCADCKRNDPRWASWNIGVFVCIRCSGIHRSMGTHISKVKSVDLDVWTPDQMASITKWGNHLANLYWEAHLKPGHIPPDHKMDSFIRSKYESRRWAMEGVPPSDPAFLENGSTSASTLAPPPAQLVSSSTSSTSSTPPPGAASRHAQPHVLLSTTASSKSRTQPRPAAQQPSAQPQKPTVVPTVELSLFDLDFRAPTQSQPQNQTSELAAAMAAPVAPAKDVKNDILSLFAAKPAPQAPVQPGFGGMGGFGAAPAANNSQMGNGAGLWGAQPGWGATTAAPPAAASNDLWGNFGSAAPAAQQPLFQTQNAWATPTNTAAAAPSMGTDVWGTSASTVAAPAVDLFSTPFSAVPAAPKKDDAFGDLWGSFK